MDNRGFLPYSKCFRSSKHSFSENLEKDKPFLVPLAGKVKTTARFELWVGCLHIPVDDVDSSLWHRCRGPVGRLLSMASGLSFVPFLFFGLIFVTTVLTLFFLNDDGLLYFILI